MKKTILILGFFLGAIAGMIAYKLEKLFK